MHIPLDFLLQVAIFLPLAMGLLILIGSSLWGHTLSKCMAFLGFLCPCLIALCLAYCYPYYNDYFGYSFYSSIHTGLEFLGIRLTLGLNGISLPLFVLSGIVGLASGLYTFCSDNENVHTYWSLLLIMLSGLLGAFASIDIFYFYFFHELALIPTFVLLGLFGGQGRRSAAIELTVYLSLGALIALAGLICIYIFSDCPSFNLVNIRMHLQAFPLSSKHQHLIFGFLLMGLGILVSLFPFHSWAPRAYAAAPTALSMLHAGVLKKFGLYGLIQIAIPLLPLGNISWASCLSYLALGNIIFLGLVTIAQKDIKLMLSYSSIMHMGYCFLGVACVSVPSLSSLAIGGTVLLMFGHGLSIALSFLLTHVLYKRIHTYDMNLMGGICQKAPVLCALFIGSIFASIGLPGFVNFWGELSIFMALWAYNPYILVVAALGLVISAIYGLRAIARIFFGYTSVYINECSKSIFDITWAERLPAILLFATLFYVGFFPQKLTYALNKTIQQVYSEHTPHF